jgi:hypothetical protein
MKTRKPSRFANIEQIKIIIEFHQAGKNRFEILQALNMPDIDDNRTWLKSQISRLIKQGHLKRKFLIKEDIKALTDPQIPPEGSPASTTSVPTSLDKKTEVQVSGNPEDDRSAAGCKPGWRRYGFIMEIATRKRFEAYAKEHGHNNYGSLCTAILKHFLNNPFDLDIKQ